MVKVQELPINRHFSDHYGTFQQNMEDKPADVKHRFISSVKSVLQCPPLKGPGYALTAVLLTLAVWSSLFALTNHETMMPGGPGFALLALLVFCLLGGGLVGLMRLPPLLGMLVVGVVVKNVPGLEFIGKSLNPSWSPTLRIFAMMVILTRGGLGLDPYALKRLSLVVLRLAFVTAFVEAIAVGLMAMWTLGLPWGYAFMLGAVICASSPAVVVPCMLNIQQRGLGVTKGVPTLIMASASVDDVMAITAFGVLFGITFSEGGLVMKIASGPLEALAGIVYGIVVGTILWYLPPKDSRTLVELRCLFLALAGIVALFGGPVIGMKAFGALATVVCAFVAGVGWKKDWAQLGRDPVAIFFNDLWFIFQPLLFGLIGTEIDMQKLQLERVGYVLLTLAAGAICRAIATSLVVFGAGLNAKERLFVVFAWIPKATVQAAFASVILDHAIEGGLSEQVVSWGFDIVTICVLSILITAPIGAALIMLSAPKLLQKAPEEVVGAKEAKEAPPILDNGDLEVF